MSPQMLAPAGKGQHDALASATDPHPLVLGAASGVALWLAFPPADWFGIAWVALFPLFLLIPSRRPRRGIYLGAWAGGFLFWLLSIQWVRLTDADAWLAWVVMALALSFWWPGFLLLARLAVHRLRIPPMIAAPVLWVGLEHVRAYILTGFPWYYLAHSQHAILPLIQIADLTGALGLSFLIAMVNAWLVDLRVLPLCEPAGDGPRLARPQILRATVVASALVATLAYGGLRLATARFEDGPRVALLQSNLIQSRKREATHDALLAIYRALVQRALRARDRPDLIVWPETAFPLPFVVRDPMLDAAAFDRIARRFDPDPKHGGDFWADWEDFSPRFLHRWTDEINVPMLVGSNLYDFQREGVAMFNAALLFEPGVAAIQRYSKIRLVPFGEYVPFLKTLPWLTVLTPYRGARVPRVTFGRGPAWFTLGRRRFATAICFEDTIPQAVRDLFHHPAVGHPPDFLLNISNDGWFHGSSEHDMHLAVSVFRAVENRVPLGRAVNTGVSALIDGNGKVLASLPKLSEGVLAGVIPLDGRSSLYTACGDWLGIACLAGTLLVIPLALMRRRVEATPRDLTSAQIR